jgi:hypothetical protein
MSFFYLRVSACGLCPFGALIIIQGLFPLNSDVHQFDCKITHGLCQENFHLCQGKVVMSYLSKVKMSYWR